MTISVIPFRIACGKNSQSNRPAYFATTRLSTTPVSVELDTVLGEADVIIVGVPHSAYRGLEIPEGILVVDMWHCLKPAVEA